MTEIKKAEDLVAVSVRQGVKMNCVEAAVVLSYIRGTGFSMSSDERFKMLLHDGDTAEGSENCYEYTVRELASLCLKMNNEMLLDESGKPEPNEDDLLDLQKDEFILTGLMKKAASVIPPVIHRYDIVILEYLKRVVPMEAASWEEAKSKVEQAWNNGEHVLTAEDFAGVSFNTGNLEVR